MSKHVISLGDLVIDLIVPVTLPIQPFEHQETRGFSPEPGGSNNFMIAGARMGMKVSSIGAVGNDLFGTFMVDILKKEGVNVDGIAVTGSAGSTLVLDLIDDATQQHVFIGSPAQGDAIPYTALHEKLLKSASALFLQGYTLLERQISTLVPAVMNRARELNIPIYFDAGPTVRHTPAEEVVGTMKQCNVLMMTEEEVPLAAGGHTGDAAYAYLLELGPSLLVIKQGADGCLLVEANHREKVPGYPVAVVDTVGAGDCFDAGFIYARLQGMSLRQSAAYANAVGAASVRKAGSGRNAPTCDEIQAIIKQFKVEVDFSC